MGKVFLGVDMRVLKRAGRAVDSDLQHWRQQLERDSEGDGAEKIAPAKARTAYRTGSQRHSIGDRIGPTGQGRISHGEKVAQADQRDAIMRNLGLIQPPGGVRMAAMMARTKLVVSSAMARRNDQILTNLCGAESWRGPCPG